MLLEDRCDIYVVSILIVGNGNKVNCKHIMGFPDYILMQRTCSNPKYANKFIREHSIKYPSVSERLVSLYHPLAEQPQIREAVSKELKEIGCRLRIWRIQTGVSRAALAKELNIEPERLLFLEMGDAQPEDFTNEQLTKLLARVTQSSEDKEFEELVHSYLQEHAL